jgi:perosamine synthetase
MTCTATNEPILSLGATPVWADVNSFNGLIDWYSVGQKITEKTKAIMVVDWGGMPCDFDHLRAVARLNGKEIPIIEDAAHSLGASYRGRMVGTLADFTCFSFQAIKHLTCVDGGALVCADKDDADRARRLRWFGIPRDIPCDFRGGIDFEEWGYKFHMNDLNATIGLANLEILPSILEQHRLIAAEYVKAFSGKVQMVGEIYEHSSSWWLFTILVDDREGFKAFMKSKNIEVTQAHARNDKFTAFDGFSRGMLPGLDYFSKKMICIPINYHMSKDDVRRVIDAVLEWHS